MTSSFPLAIRRSLLPGIVPVFAVLAVLLLPESAEGQYFGRNKVQYDAFDFRVMKTPHFDIHYYPEAAVAIEDAARMSERWYERLARTFQHEFERPKPVILYADHPDFQQTNTLQGFISEGVGGVTESLKNRVIMPLAGTYHDTDHVLGHELVHAFQYNIAQSRRGGGLRGMAQLPLWLVEGMAEYLSVGREDPLTAMWLRDALLRDDVPTLEQMTRERRFFPYRFGQAFWTYIGGTYGDEVVTELYRRSLRVGWENALVSVLGKTQDSVSVDWHAAIEGEYRPLIAGRSAPGEVGALLLAPSTGAGTQNVAPSISPDGRYVAFISEKDLFSVDLFLADARTGEIIRRLSSAAADEHMDALRFLDSSGSWSPDGRLFVFVAIADGDNQLVIVDAEDSDVEQRIEVESANIGAISNPAWSPDGRSIVFAGQSGGIADLFMVDIETQRVTRLTNDKHGDMQPAFSPDGSTLAFVSDRGSETDFSQLSFSRPRISLMDMETRQIRTLDLFGNVKHLNPQFTPDGRGLYFISDQDGFSDIYRVNLPTGEIYRVTNVATAVSGITSGSPAMSVASETGTLVFSVFDEFEFHIYSLSSQEAGANQALASEVEVAPGRLIPPSEPGVRSRVTAYLADPLTGLPPIGTYTSDEASTYDPGLKLDYVGQPMIGVGAGDRYGNNLEGAAAAFFSDMLGDRTLGVAVQAQGTIKDLGGQFFYQNMKRRWNWGASGGRIPYQLLWASYEYGPNGLPAYKFLRERIFIDSATGMLAYPFSTTQRVESRLGITRYSFDLEEETLYLDPLGRLMDRRVENLGAPQDPLTLAHVSIALVGDNSYSAFTSPVRGSRYRFEFEHTVGTADYRTLTGDYRRYFNPVRELTIGFRGLHYGRYGITEEETGAGLRPLFVGYESLIRGYARESYDFTNCTDSVACDRRYQQYLKMFGQRLHVFNFEFRIPVTGVSQYGLINLPFLPIELVTFADVGLAWDNFADVDLRFDTQGDDHVPLFSTGISARANLLGFLILETYYAYPFQRPDKGWHWGFTLTPGW